MMPARICRPRASQIPSLAGSSRVTSVSTARASWGPSCNGRVLPSDASEALRWRVRDRAGDRSVNGFATTRWMRGTQCVRHRSMNAGDRLNISIRDAGPLPGLPSRGKARTSSRRTRAMGLCPTCATPGCRAVSTSSHRSQGRGRSSPSPNSTTSPSCRGSSSPCSAVVAEELARPIRPAPTRSRRTRSSAACTPMRWPSCG